MSILSEKWNYLGTRTVSAIVLVLIAGAAALSGPVGFAIFVSIAAGMMQWELSRLHGASTAWLPVIAGIFVTFISMLPSLAFMLGALMPMPVLSPIIITILVIMVFMHKRDRLFFLLYTMAIILTGWALSMLFGRSVLIPMLIAIVIATDVAGYFVGKTLGGPKFWPSLSPKKTWSGIIGGWVASIAVVVVLGLFWQVPTWAIFAAPFLSFAAQLGDIAESGLKRRAGVKDSSNLIPGHGGFLDRFDGIIGASSMMILVTMLDAIV